MNVSVPSEGVEGTGGPCDVPGASETGDADCTPEQGISVLSSPLCPGKGENGNQDAALPSIPLLGLRKTAMVQGRKHLSPAPFRACALSTVTSLLLHFHLSALTLGLGFCSVAMAHC